MDRPKQHARASRRTLLCALLLPAASALAAPPQVMLTLSRDEHYFHAAYDDRSDLDGDGRVEYAYTDAIDYDGYFHPHLCYDYSDVTMRFEPVGVTDSSAHRHYCLGAQAGSFSGNFLNWATMTRLDLLRRAMYGGRRAVDSTAETVLERAALPSDTHSFAKYYNQADLAALTPFDTQMTDASNGGNGNGYDDADEGITLCNATIDNGTALSQLSTALPVVRIAQGNRQLWAGNERWQCTWESERGDNSNANNPAQSGLAANSSDPPDSARLLTAGGSAERVLRVLACAGTDASDNLEHCLTYPSGNRKPVGIVQEFGAAGAVSFGLLSGSWARNHSGGVLRRNAGPVDDEIASGSDGHFLAPANGGLIAFLDTLRVWGYQYADGAYFPGADNCGFQLALPAEGRCAAWDNPLGEMFFETLRYLAGDGAPLFAANDTGYFASLPNVAWSNGIVPSDPPTSQHVIVLNGSEPSFDVDQIDITRFGTDTLAGLAGYAHTQDLRDTIDGTQTVTTWALEFDPRRGAIAIPIGPAGAAKQVVVTPEHRLLGNDSRGTLVNLLTVSPHREVDTGDRASGGLPNTTPDGIADISSNGIPTVNIPVAKPGSGIFHAKYLLLFDDTARGADRDQDLAGTLDYVVNTTVAPALVTITTKVITQSTANPQLFGFSVRGTTQDGFHAFSGIRGANFVDTSGVLGCSNCRALNETGGQRGAQAHAFSVSPVASSPVPLLAEAARWGGFVDTDGDGTPNLDHEWDRYLADGTRAPLLGGIPVGDGVPDNYFALANPGRLHDTLATLLNRILQPPLFSDHDGDNRYDDDDNCPTAANPDQLDTNADGHGNLCDADLNNDGVVNLRDFVGFRLAFGTAYADADFDGDGSVNLRDFFRFRQLYGTTLP